MGSEMSSGLLTAGVGAILGAAVTLLIQCLGRRDTYRQGAYTERAKAVQDLLNHARVVKDACVHAQAAQNTPNAQAAVKAVDDAKAALLRQAFFHDVWISENRGVQSIRDFNDAINGNQMQAMASRQAVEAALAQPFDQLRKALKKDLGFEPR